MRKEFDYLIIGAGFSGLTLGLRLAEKGKSVILIESEEEVGGLASDFRLSNGKYLERFYHHWFRHDINITKLVEDLGLGAQVREYSSNTGMYFNKKFWNLSTPTDLLRFKAISLVGRIRLGIAILIVRRIKNWEQIESKSIREWLEPLCGSKTYKVVWEPLVSAKFSQYSEDVSAAWMWKKLVLRGGTRSRNGSETLLYIDGGFGRLARIIAERITQMGGQIVCGEKIAKISTSADKVDQILSQTGKIYSAKKVIFTGAPSELKNIMDGNYYPEWSSKLNSVKYLANICLVLLLDRSLSETYWLNVNDPGFPFVGVIEHTNLVSEKEYGNLHVVYLSKYIDSQHIDYHLTDEEYLTKSLKSLKLMFPDFRDDWIKEFYIWRTPFAQPITTKNYSRIKPDLQTPFSNLFLNTMAQIYPEDRGTNYAVRNAESLAKILLEMPDDVSPGVLIPKSNPKSI